MLYTLVWFMMSNVNVKNEKIVKMYCKFVHFTEKRNKFNAALSDP